MDEIPLYLTNRFFTKCQRLDVYVRNFWTKHTFCPRFSNVALHNCTRCILQNCIVVYNVIIRCIKYNESNTLQGVCTYSKRFQVCRRQFQTRQTKRNSSSLAWIKYTRWNVYIVEIKRAYNDTCTLVETFSLSTVIPRKGTQTPYLTRIRKYVLFLILFLILTGGITVSNGPDEARCTSAETRGRPDIRGYRTADELESFTTMDVTRRTWNSPRRVELRVLVQVLHVPRIFGLGLVESLAPTFLEIKRDSAMLQQGRISQFLNTWGEDTWSSVCRRNDTAKKNELSR